MRERIIGNEENGMLIVKIADNRLNSFLNQNSGCNALKFRLRHGTELAKLNKLKWWDAEPTTILDTLRKQQQRSPPSFPSWEGSGVGLAPA